MKFNFKKIASVLATTVMLGSTIAFASAAWPAPFVESGANQAAVVIGANSMDLAAATEVGAALDAKITVAGGALSGDGDMTVIDSSSRRLYYADSINAAKLSVSSSEMPTVLADGKVSDLGGVEYKYTQSIVLGDTVTSYSTSGGDIKDPVLLLDVGTTAGDPLYNYTLSLTKNLNVSDSTNVQGQKIKILGVDYVIGASSTNSTLYLYGAGETVSMGAGETKTISIAGKEHTVEFVGATATTTAKITLDGVGKTVTKGTSYSFAGDVNVYVKDVTYQSYAGGLQNVELIVGANTLLIQNGQSVKIGADQTTIQGTMGYITAADVGKISGLTVQVAAKKSQEDHIGIGGYKTDPVFGGLKMQFVAANPALGDALRGKVKVDTDNNQYAYVTFTSARAGEKGEQKLTFVYDNATSSSSVAPLLAHQTIGTSAKGEIHVMEGENALQNDWIIINQGDAGTILQVEDISINSGTEGTVTFSDVITGDEQKVTLTNSTGSYRKTGVNFYGGNGYIVAVNPAGTTVNITWSSGTTRTLFPRIKFKDGGWIALLKQQSVSNGSTIILPNGLTTLSTDGTQVINSTHTYTASGITWTAVNGSSTVDINGIAGPTCNFNSTKGPAVLIMEPKKWDDSSQGNFICVPLTTTGTTEIAIGDPVFNGTNSGFVTLDSDVYKKAAVDKYGAFVTKEDRTNENGVATITLPASQMYFDIKLTSDKISSEASTVKVVKDSEADSVKTKNLIVVGGSCINTVAAKMLGSSTPVCGADFTAKAKVAAGQWLVKVAASPLQADKLAMLVAGYEQADTLAGAKAVAKDGASTDVGEKVYPVTK